VKISQRAFPQGAPVVYVARGTDFPDALAGGTLTDGPVLLVPSCSAIPSTVLDEIRRVDPQQVVALGGTAAICPAVLEAAANA
jgi:putative cell wall-binding protein